MFSLIRQGRAAARPMHAARRVFQFRNFPPSAPVPAATLPGQTLVRTGSREAGPLLAKVGVRKVTMHGPSGSAANPVSTGEDTVRGDAAAERGTTAAFRRARSVVA
ncbi:hypothetical protein Bcep18194_B2256 [Burkholderia lata]|uniref:Uncharacterized protein n=1 Tax=Burkholderia lata (strain ATCC 17760 / DSM 23089 / LMG 22485 / NCIMB 9086 / R18194 / 383) TaxID=482957 RepID=Q393J9_BURL3|nr:hypothetical protein Bcep18194_B2256 [Burkholderia lata]